MGTHLNADFIICICNFMCLLLLVSKAEDDANATIPESLE